jgi:hypothetical protein
MHSLGDRDPRRVVIAHRRSGQVAGGLEHFPRRHQAGLVETRPERRTQLGEAVATVDDEVDFPLDGEAHQRAAPRNGR